MWSGVSSTPTPVPPAGFLNLSAVSWQIRACGPVSCRYRPWATSPFRALPRRDRAPVSGSPAPLRSSPRALRALTRPCHHGFRRRLLHRWSSCRCPPAATDYLSARRPWLARLPVDRDHAQRARARPRGSSASKPRSPCKAVLLSPASLLAGAALLSWAFRPSRAFSTRSWDPLADPPHPRSAERTAHDCSHTARDFRDLATPGSGEPGQAPALRGCLASSSADTDPVWTGPCHLSAAVLLPRPSSHAKATSRATGPRSFEVNGQRHLLRTRRRRQLSWGS